MEKNKKLITINFIALNTLLLGCYFSNIKSLLEVYNFQGKEVILEGINNIDLDTSKINDYFSELRKSFFYINVENKVVEEKVEYIEISENMPNFEDKKTEQNAIVSGEHLSIEKIMIAGDSMAQSLEWGLKELYPKKIINKARHSTGLTVLSYYNWEKNLQDFIVENSKANVLVFMVGANDAQDLFVEKKYMSFGSEGWKAEYKNRIRKIINVVNQSNIEKLVWVGQPIMRTKNFDKKMDVLNECYEEVIKEINNNKFVFVSTKELLSINGEYSADINKKLARASDGIHMSAYGTFLIANKIKENLDN